MLARRLIGIGTHVLPSNGRNLCRFLVEPFDFAGINADQWFSITKTGDGAFPRPCLHTRSIYRIMYIMENTGYIFLFKWLDSSFNSLLNLNAATDQASGTSSSMPS